MEQLWKKNKEELFALYESGGQGLSSAEAAARLEKYGENKLKEKKKKTMLQRFSEQFRDVMILILIGLPADVIAEMILLSPGYVYTILKIQLFDITNTNKSGKGAYKMENKKRCRTAYSNTTKG